jgi:DNA polymerase
VPGKGTKPSALVLVGEAPGADEDRLGEPFVGRAGRLLDRAVAQAGLDRGSLFITNVVKCRPPDNRRPAAVEMATCRPFLEGELADSQPAALVALGKTAAEAVLGRPVAVKRARGPVVTDVAGRGCPVWVALHPAAARYNKGAVDSIAAVLVEAARAAGLGPGASLSGHRPTFALPPGPLLWEGPVRLHVRFVDPSVGTVNEGYLFEALAHHGELVSSGREIAYRKEFSATDERYIGDAFGLFRKAGALLLVGIEVKDWVAPVTPKLARTYLSTYGQSCDYFYMGARLFLPGVRQVPRIGLIDLAGPKVVRRAARLRPDPEAWRYVIASLASPPAAVPQDPGQQMLG